MRSFCKLGIFDLLLVVNLLGVAQVAIAGAVEAKKEGVKVLTAADKNSELLGTLAKGEALDAGERKGMYWEVQYQGKPAFVSVMDVKRTQADAGALGAALRDAVTQGRQEDDAANARQRSAVMGVRGLDEDEKTAFAGNVKPNLRMVYAMEDILVTDQELDEIGELVFSEVEGRSSKKQ
jgi:hypothetical protein